MKARIVAARIEGPWRTKNMEKFQKPSADPRPEPEFSTIVTRIGTHLEQTTSQRMSAGNKKPAPLRYVFHRGSTLASGDSVFIVSLFFFPKRRKSMNGA